MVWNLTKNNSKKLEKLRRSQEIESQLEKSIVETEALQSGGDDRPEGETHINEILKSDEEEGYNVKPKKGNKNKFKSSKKNKPKTAKKKRR